MTGTADEGFGAHPFGEVTRAQLELARTLLTPLGAQPEAFGGWSRAGAQPKRPARHQ